MMSALSGLDEAARDRVFAYICTRLNLKSPPRVITQQAASEQAVEARSTPDVPPSTENKDIRTFKEQKSPRSANEMAAVVAYFLQYEANEIERKDSITKSDVEKYFHLAKFKMPKDGNFTLVNSKNAGYLDQRGKGNYALNPVGYNLVAHNSAQADLPKRRPHELARSELNLKINQQQNASAET
jgi:hypothetical protein